ncbi:PREDICTED: protein Simiate [Dinoponera quadriceps]|uniref:Protein Simiate n=1 Tax=Dinoponera quadriceps TaxID=609295 RepID=A0A6P3XGE4_DINQU|nr:PREDICTED: protein Simiate [Dinoponera quadriceps]XP_014477501.1 PREDICTED: protein Simiate [Dinoponera quadriceps]XP_014477510.1 PREDICTED: protein Simiate [Dinoponera quadriceps]XP_014477519.1 PREDICTED: protein Simiate [Dinoponera quadriceps]XP_014477528.1 PREDICTED: protein Simiate [Dinoponera quadriceps]
MNSLRANDNIPLNKRFKPDDDCKYEKEECENMEEKNAKEDFLEKAEEQENNIVENDDKASAVTDDETFPFPPDGDISDMLDEVQYNGYFPTVTERYFTTYYKMNVQSPGDDICIRIHSNRMCMFSLAPSHVIFTQGDRDITKVDFKISDKLDRALNKVSGKSKHGGQALQANSNICTVFCSDGQKYLIKCCMIGKLVEVNEILSEKPQLLRELPHKGGYLAIILPNIKHLENLRTSLLTHEQYVKLVGERRKEEPTAELKCGSN